MERQLISQSGQFILPNFLYSHPNANLSTILDFIIQEGINPQTIKLFTEYVTLDFQKFWEMLLIINFDETNQDSRYPFILTETIKYQSENIFDFLFQLNPIELCECIEFLFQTLENDYLEAPNAAYFSKFICFLIDSRGIYLWNHLSNNNGKYFFDDLMKHINNNHIADVVYNLIGLTNMKGQYQMNYKEQRIQLLQRTIQMLQNKYYDSEIVENICNILINLLKNVTELDYKQLILQTLYIPVTFFMLILSTKSDQLVDLLILLLSTSLQYNIETQTQQLKPNFQFDIQQFQEIGKQFALALKMETNQTNFMSTYGQEQEILGQTKLKLIEFYFNVLQTQNYTLINYFDHQEIWSILMQFIQKYEFNNSLQNYFLQIIFYIFSNENLGWIQQTIFDMDLLGFLCLLNQNYYKQVGKIKKPITKGYSGMANKLSFYFQQTIYTDQWNNYINNHQSVLNLEVNYLLGIPPTEKSNNSSEIITQKQQEQNKEDLQIKSDQTLPDQINEDQLKIAIVTAENNFQDQPNIGEIFGEQILHQVKFNKYISFSGEITIPADNDFNIKFRSKSLIITEKKNKERRSHSQEKVVNNQMNQIQVDVKKFK